MSKRFERNVKRFSWESLPLGGIVAAYQHLHGDGVVPRCYQCVGKTDGRDGGLGFVLMELCFSLDVEQEVDDLIMGTAVPLAGKFASGAPVRAEAMLNSDLKIGGVVFRPWEGMPMRFKIPKRSHHLTNAAGERFLAEKNPWQ